MNREKNVICHVDLLSEADDQVLSIKKCVCGEKFDDWAQILSTYDEDHWKCPHCDAELYFYNEITVMQILKENNDEQIN